MIFESEYRRQAMDLWEQSREQTKQELLEDIQHHHTRILRIKQRLRDMFAGHAGTKRTT
ncbi:hypothetical protein [Paenibacillus abyssi]|uniref:Uncharacterized protein n=1 Tax=Paenibacillus abyssi TaxID=1340531 RepID=A0A917CU38_9BACL|nr:hypothetical protein [Paenibacillus abyssi]GGF97868.1 hypothetical protein GCM10010916_13870 [Paenibacillus abyssi]